ncbi:glycosyltransferase family 4 protein [Escherichia coli]
MKVLHIARNVPIKSLRGNPVILDLINRLSQAGIVNKLAFPAEYIPSFSFLRGRPRIFSELKGEFNIGGLEVLFVNFIRIPGRWSFLFSRFYFNKKKLDKFSEGVNCIHAHYIIPDGLVAYELAKNKNIPYIVTIRQGDLDRINKLKYGDCSYKQYEKVVSNAAFLLAINPNIANEIKRIFQKNCITIPHGVDKSLIEYGIENRIHKKIIVAAQFIKRKNIDWVIKVFNSMTDQGISNYTLTIIGEGELENDLKKLASGNDKIIFKPWLSKKELMGEFLLSDIFIMPSDQETFGMVYIEAAAKNCLIIGKKDTGVDGYFENEKNALFISTVGELEIVIKKILLGLIDIREMQNLGTILVEKNMTWDKVTSNYIKLYHKAIANVQNQ